MLYSLKRIGIYIRKNILVYLLIIAQLTAGLGLFIAGINVVNTAEYNLQQEKIRMSRQIIDINVTQSPSMDELLNLDGAARFSICYEDYLQLQKQFEGKLELLFSMQQSESIREDKENGLDLFVRCYFMNDAKFEMLFGTKIDENAIYAGSNVQPILQEFINKKLKSVIFKEKYPDKNTGVQFIYVQDGEIKLMNKHTLNLQPLPKEAILYKASALIDVDVWSNDCIIIPMKYYPEVEDEFRIIISQDNNPKEITLSEEESMEGTIRRFEIINPPSPELSIKYIDENFDEAIISEVLNYLNDSNEYGYIYVVDDQTGEMQRLIIHIKSVVNAYQIKAAALLAIALLGNMGVMMLFLQSRKKSLAIAKAYGASNLRLTLEIFVELAIVNLTGAVLSLFAVKGMIPIIQEGYNLKAVTQPQNILYAAAFAIVCSILPTIYAMVSVNKIQPIEVLKND